MSYTVEKLTGEPVVLIRFNADFDAQTEAWAAIQASNVLIAQQTEPVFSVWDVQQSKVDFEALMAGTNAARLDSTPVPNLCGSAVIANSAAVKLAMKGMDSDMYRHQVVPVFAGMDEALAFIHEQLSKHESA